ncbi:MAG: OpgC domain-containing protein [Candidatus Hydrogenedentes bacterium]|nr:OpgC domain-containing protein [Candidatus Hydrogenedentota bacterium]
MLKLERDPRVDFFRGMALLLIFWDHVLSVVPGHSRWFHFTPRYWGYSDAAELFVFLSGFVFGLVYERVYQSRGYWMCQAKALRRCSQLYVANIFTFIAVVGIAGLFYTRLEVSPKYLETFFSEPGVVTPRALVFNYVPVGFGILPLYILLLLCMPAMLHLLHRWPALAITISLLVYLAAQVFPHLNLPRY